MDAVITVYHQILITKYTKAASLSILIYDYLLTIDNEITLIWKAKWGIGKVFFLLARYTAMVDMPWSMYVSVVNGLSPVKCFNAYASSFWLGVFGIACAEAILFVRTSALYGNARWMAVAVAFIWLAVLISCMVIDAFWFRTIAFSPAPFPWWQGCYLSKWSKLIYGSYVALLLQETVVVVLTIYQAVLTGMDSNDRLVKILYRDGLFYFIYLFFIAVANIILLAIGPIGLLELIAPFQRVMHAVLVPRILLHARGAARHREVTMTELRFAVTSIVHGHGTLSVAPEPVEQPVHEMKHSSSEDVASTSPVSPSDRALHDVIL